MPILKTRLPTVSRLTHRRLRPIHALVFCALLATVPAQGTSYVPVSDSQMADGAELVARVELGESRVVRHRGRVMTEYPVDVLDLIKGEPSASSLVLRILGGHSAELGLSLEVFGAPEFGPGQKALLFLDRQADGSYRLHHFLQGAFYEVRHGGERLLARDTAEARVMKIRRSAIDDTGVTANDDAAEEAGWRHAERFAEWLRDRSAGFVRAADYRVPAPEDRDQFRADFTLLHDSLLLRWFEFDEGAAVRWHRHQDGQAGLPDGGLLAFNRALRAWRDEPNTPVRYLNAGTTSSDLGFSAEVPVGQNVILFDDRNDDISTDFSCSRGGIMAIGGVTAYRTGSETYKGAQWRAIAEAAIVINNGARCALAGNQALAEELYTHELGHTFGLGHSCGDNDSPACNTSSRFDDSIMRAVASDDGRASTLGRDDIEGLRYLYQNGFTSAPCELPPGNGNFCSACGPCGEGQGDCDTDAQCGAGLICAQNVGERHGFRPNIDVCELPGGPPPPPPSTCNLPDGHGRFCTDCGPCGAGEGDCDNDTECRAGLRCVNDVGADFGFNPNIDVCIGTTTSCHLPAGHGRFCSECGPCAADQGDCDSNAECQPGLTCVDNIGAQFGFPPAVDVCQ